MAIVPVVATYGSLIDMEEIGNSRESMLNLLKSQKALFRSQVNEFHRIVNHQCKLTGTNPLAQEMAASSLGYRTGKKAKDSLNPKVLKYLQSIFSIKDTTGKKETREISALCRITVTQVRDFFNAERSKVKKLVQKSERIASDISKAVAVGCSTPNQTQSSAKNELVINITPNSTIVENGTSCYSNQGTVTSASSQSPSTPENVNLLSTESVGSSSSYIQGGTWDFGKSGNVILPWDSEIHGNSQYSQTEHMQILGNLEEGFQENVGNFNDLYTPLSWCPGNLNNCSSNMMKVSTSFSNVSTDITNVNSSSSNLSTHISNVSTATVSTTVTNGVDIFENNVNASLVQDGQFPINTDTTHVEVGSTHGVDSSDKEFIERIFSMMRKEQTFAGRVKLMEWVLQIQNKAVLTWFSTKGGIAILASWLNDAALEEQTTVLSVIFKVFCHMPLEKAQPLQMSGILQTVNKLRFYRNPDISKRAKVLLSSWSKMVVRAQALKNARNRLKNGPLTKRKNGALYDKLNLDIPEEIYAFAQDAEDHRGTEPEPGNGLKLLTNDTSSKKQELFISAKKTKERRKVQLVEHPDSKLGRNTTIAKATSSNQSRPLSADDIKKAKMRAMHMHEKHGKAYSPTENGQLNDGNTPTAVRKPSPHNQTPSTSNAPQPSRLRINEITNLQERPMEKLLRVQIQWCRPPVNMNSEEEDSKTIAETLKMMKESKQKNENDNSREDNVEQKSSKKLVEETPVEEEVNQKKERRTKNRNDPKICVKKIEDITLETEENEDDDFVDPPPRESTRNAALKEQKESYRCGLQPTFNIIKFVREKKGLTNRQMELLKSSPFYNFFKVFYDGDIELRECKKHIKNLDAVYSCFSVDDNSFIFGKEKLFVRAKDISLLFGLPMLGTNIEPVSKTTSKTIPIHCKDFAKRNFGTSSYMTRVNIEKRIKEEVGKKKMQNEEDLPILLIMDMLCTFFFPNNQQKLRWGLLEYICDFEKMSRVSWPLTIATNFHKFVRKFIHNPRNMSGCSMLPMYCMCEKMKLIKQRFNASHTAPRFAQWDLKRLKDIVSKEFLDGILEGEVREIEHIRPHEIHLLETVENVSSKLKTVKENRKQKKRKQDEKHMKPKTFEEEVEFNVLHIHIQNIEKQNKRLKKELKAERILRKEAQKEITILEQELNRAKSDACKGEDPRNDAKTEEVFKNSSDIEEEEKKEEDPVSVDTTFNHPNFNLNITQQMMDIRKESVEELKKKSEEKVEPASYVKRLKMRARKTTKRKSFVYSATQKARQKKKNVVDEEAENKIKTESKSEDEEVKKEEKIEKKEEELEAEKIPKPLAVIEPSWQELGLLHCPCLNYLTVQEQAKVKQHFSICKATKKDVARKDGTVLGGCFITNDMIISLLQCNTIDGQLIDWFAKNCALAPHNYAVPTAGTKSLVDNMEALQNVIVLPILKKVVEDNLTEEVYFPLHCDHHWTLVTLKYANMQWAHYDSNRPRRSNENNNSSLKAAMKLRVEVEKILQQLWEKARIHDKQLSNHEMHQLDCAQQGSDTLDCGIFVMLFIIASNRTEVPMDVPKMEVIKIRAKLAYEVITAAGYLWDLGDHMASFHHTST